MQDPWKVPRHLGGKLIAGPEDLPKVGERLPPDVVCRPAAGLLACINAIKRLRRERADIRARSEAEDKMPEDAERWLENTRALSSWIMGAEPGTIDAILDAAERELGR